MTAKDLRPDPPGGAPRRGGAAFRQNCATPYELRRSRPPARPLAPASPAIGRRTARFRPSSECVYMAVHDDPRALRRSRRRRPRPRGGVGAGLARAVRRGAGEGSRRAALLPVDSRRGDGRRRAQSGGRSRARAVAAGAVDRASSPRSPCSLARGPSRSASGSAWRRFAPASSRWACAPRASRRRCSITSASSNCRASSRKSTSAPSARGSSSASSTPATCPRASRRAACA